MRADWPSLVIESLCRSKRQGIGDYDAAWSIAMRAHPPRARDCGGFRPTLLPEPGEAETMQEFVYRVGYDAWVGNQPVLRHFSPLLLADVGDHSGAAHGRSRQVAA